MKKILILLTLLVVLFSSCDKIVEPYKTIIEIDTTLFTDGIWADYPWPEFTANTNTIKNVLLEDYTGHKCPNCPNAASIAKGLEEANPGRLFSVAIHSGQGGSGLFQWIIATCGDEIANPENKFCHDFTTDEGEEFGITFANGFGFGGNPYGNFNRKGFGQSPMFIAPPGWSSISSQALSETELIVDLQAKSNFFEDVNGGYLHIESDFKEAYSKNVNMVVYLVENEFIGWQDSSGIELDHYHHHNVFLGCIDGLAFGKSIGTSFEASEKVYTDYSFTIPVDQTKEEFHYLIYVYDVETYEVMQVIKHEL